MTKEQLAELRLKAKLATKGVWPERFWIGGIEWPEGLRATIIPHGPLHQYNSEAGNEQAIRDSEHIAAFNPEVALQLLDWIDELERHAEADAANAKHMRSQLAESQEKLARLEPCRGCPTVECTCMSELEEELLIKLTESKEREALLRKDADFIRWTALIEAAHVATNFGYTAHPSTSQPWANEANIWLRAQNRAVAEKILELRGSPAPDLVGVIKVLSEALEDIADDSEERGTVETANWALNMTREIRERIGAV